MIYSFGRYELDTSKHELRCDCQPVHVRPKVFELLRYLVTHADRALSKQDLIDALWADQAVSDSVLTTAIRDAREAVGDTGIAQKMIQTVHGHGYRLVAEVQHTKRGPTAAAGEDTGSPQAPAAPSSSQDTLEVACAAVGPNASHAGEHKAVSVLACRIHQTPAAAGRASAEALHGLRQRYEVMSRDVVSDLQGTVVRVLEESFVALFGAPVAHEDHVYRALTAAIRLRDRVDDLNRDRAAGPDKLLGVSIGLHTGRVLVSPRSTGAPPTVTAVGNTLRLAQSLSDTAASGAIAVSHPMHSAAERRARTRPLTPASANHDNAVELVDLETPIARRSVLALDGVHGLTPFVGREMELGVLRAMWRHASAGRGQVVGLVGEPGVGKSRLLLQFSRERSNTTTPVLACQCLSYAQSTPYFPLAQLLRHACNIDERDDAIAADDKVAELAGGTGLNWSDENRHLLLDLFQIATTPSWEASRAELGPQAVKNLAFGLFGDLILALARSEPLLIAVEDLHWVDATSNEWLAYLVPRMAGVSALLLATYRPGYRPPWIDRSFATQQALQPLSDEESLCLVQGVVRNAPVTDNTMSAILRKAEGNPLFLEELAYTAVERQDSDGDAEIPDSVHAVVTARIDRLPATAKHTLQVSAVVGREIPLRLLRVLVGLSPQALTASLAALEAAEHLFEVQSATEDTYAFKHALTQDAAYALLLNEDRRDIHARAADALAEGFAHVVQTQPEVLAQHCTEAGRLGDAIAYWVRAGQLAIERSANVEAISHLQHGLDVVALLPEGLERDEAELLLQTSLAAPQLMLLGHVSPNVTATQTRIRELSTRTGRALECFFEFAITLVAGKLAPARAIAEQMLQLGDRTGDSGTQVQGNMCLSYALFHLGDTLGAAQAVDRCLAIYDPRKHRYIAFVESQGHDPGLCASIYKAHVLWLLGHPEQAKHHSIEAVTLGRRLDHPFSLAMVLYMAAWNGTFTQDVSGVERSSEEAIAQCDEHGFPFWRAGAMVTQGWARAKRGDVAAGLKQMREGIAGWQATGAQVGVPYFWGLVAEIAAEAGLAEEVRHAVTAGYKVAKENGEGFYVSELKRMEGALALLGDTPDEQAAEDLFDEARRMARDQQALSLELRAAISMGRLWQAQGKRQAGHNLVSAVYKRFTEGFDTPDLVEARQLLEALA